MSARLWLMASALLAAFIPVSAQGAAPPDHERPAEATSRSVVFEGFVLDPDGVPAEGAVVVSSAGGRAVAGRNGSYLLEAQVPIAAETIQITAAGRREPQLLASTTVAVSAASPYMRIDPIRLTQGGPCQPRWLPTFGSPPGTNGTILALTMFDAGGGMELYAGGDFTSAGGLAANHFAKWDGSRWSASSGGMDGVVRTLLAHDDGGGSMLYAGGDFTSAGGAPALRIAAWDGSSWSALGTGTNGPVRALAMHDDGSGLALYAGGDFTTAGGQTVNRIAKWDGSSWSALGGGMDGAVHALATYDAGGGPWLYAGGDFTTAGGVSVRRLARWDGSSWAPLGNGVRGGGAPSVRVLAVHDDGGGPELYAGGDFTIAGGQTANYIAKWNGGSWAPVGGPMNSPVYALSVHDDGDGPAPYAGGGAFFVGRWNGSSWVPVGTGNFGVRALATHEGGSPTLYAGGVAGPRADNLYKWDGSSWASLGKGLNGPVAALATYDDGSGPVLFVGGEFDSVDGVRVNHIARWDESSWSALGSGTDGNVLALTTYDDGSGPALYVGGSFRTPGAAVTVRGIARWDGSSWSALGSGLNGGVTALAVHDDGSGLALYACGSFTAAGGAPANNIARWNGTSWSALGAGLGTPTSNSFVTSLAVYDAGEGPALYAGGDFLSGFIRKWNGSSWSAVLGINGSVNDLIVHDDGSGPALYAGGGFTTAGGAAANGIARWNGASWSTLGSGVNGGGVGAVVALAVYDDGGGPALYAGGSFHTAGGVAARNIAKWDGSSWIALGSGTDSSVSALIPFGAGGGALHVGGRFTGTFVPGDSYLARWRCPPATVQDNVRRR